MEFSGQSLVKSVGISPASGDLFGSPLIKQRLSGVSAVAASDVASFVSSVSFTPDENIAEASANPRPSHRIIPADETGTHQVTFTVTISVAFPPGMSALYMCTKNMFS